MHCNLSLVLVISFVSFYRKFSQVEGKKPLTTLTQYLIHTPTFQCAYIYGAIINGSRYSQRMNTNSTTPNQPPREKNLPWTVLSITKVRHRLLYPKLPLKVGVMRASKRNTLISPSCSSGFSVLIREPTI